MCAMHGSMGRLKMRVCSLDDRGKLCCWHRQHSEGHVDLRRAPQGDARSRRLYPVRHVPPASPGGCPVPGLCRCSPCGSARGLRGSGLNGANPPLPAGETEAGSRGASRRSRTRGAAGSGQQRGPRAEPGAGRGMGLGAGASELPRELRPAQGRRGASRAGGSGEALPAALPARGDELPGPHRPGFPGRSLCHPSRGASGRGREAVNGQGAAEAGGVRGRASRREPPGELPAGCPPPRAALSRAAPCRAAPGRTGRATAGRGGESGGGGGGQAACPARLGTARLGTARHGSARRGTAWCGSARHGTVPLGSARRGSGGSWPFKQVAPAALRSRGWRAGAARSLPRRRRALHTASFSGARSLFDDEIMLTCLELLSIPWILLAHDA